MNKRGKFDMGTTRGGTSDQADSVDTVEVSSDDPYERVNFEIRSSFRQRFNVEAARRGLKKRELINEVFEYYFADK